MQNSSNLISTGTPKSDHLFSVSNLNYFLYLLIHFIFLLCLWKSGLFYLSLMNKSYRYSHYKKIIIIPKIFKIISDTMYRE